MYLRNRYFAFDMLIFLSDVLALYQCSDRVKSITKICNSNVMLLK
jgi:hypothetical protein